MKFIGEITKSGKWWAIEVPALDVVSQGKTKAEAYMMIADAIESLVNREDFEVTVYPGSGGKFVVESNDSATMVAFLLKQRRLAAGVSLDEVRRRLNLKSRNAYARYENGSSVPTVDKLDELLGAVEPGRGVVWMIGEAK